MMRSAFSMPSQADIVDVLRRHPLIRLKESVQRAFVVGSFAIGAQNEESDVDVLLEVTPKDGWSAPDLEAHYRRGLQQHFITHGIAGKADELHPQWCGRRVDVYFTHDASAESRPKIELSTDRPAHRRRRGP